MGSQCRCKLRIKVKVYLEQTCSQLENHATNEIIHSKEGGMDKLSDRQYVEGNCK